MAVHHDDRRAFALDPLHRIALQLGVDRQVLVLAGRARLAGQLADDAADRVHFDAAVARLAAQFLIANPLDAAPADLEARQLQERVGAAGEILFRHGADIADDMGKGVVIRVIPCRAGIRLNTGKVRAVDVQGCELIP